MLLLLASCSPTIEQQVAAYKAADTIEIKEDMYIFSYDDDPNDVNFKMLDENTIYFPDENTITTTDEDVVSKLEKQGYVIIWSTGKYFTLEGESLPKI